MQDNLEPLANGLDFAGVSIHKGFPNPAADSLADPAAGGGRSGLALDLNPLLIRHPSSTYLFRIRGEHWAEQGIFDGDIAIIDRALQPHAQDLVLTWQDETFEIYQYQVNSKHHYIWGVVNAIIHPRSQGDFL